MADEHFRERLLASIRDPWTLLLSIFGGATAWALGATIALSAATTVVMVGTGAVVGALTRPRHETPAQLRAGAPQQRLINLLDAHVRSLRALQSTTLPDIVQPNAHDALLAAGTARPSVLQMAAAVDALDEAIAAAHNVSGLGGHAADSINNTIGRLKTRRARLLERLTTAVDEIATVYAGLLELSATARTTGISVDDTDVGAVNDSVTLLQMTFAELENDAANLPIKGHRLMRSDDPALHSMRLRPGTSPPTM